MKIHILTAEHFRVPGIITKAFADLAGAEAEAMDLTNLMLTDNGQAKSANASNWRAKVEALQDEHGAAHCYVEIAEMDVHGAPADPVRDAAQDMLEALRSAVASFEQLARINRIPDNMKGYREARAAIAKAEGAANG